MTSLRHRLCVLFLLTTLSAVSHAATGYGHFILAREIIREGIAGKTFPPELTGIMGDPDCQNAFCGGAVAPDIAENFSHYGKTSDAVQGMLSSAREHLAAAQQAGDAAAMKTAQRELAFSYGWLTHCAADLEVHPAVNAFPQVGDAFKYLDTAHQGAHGAAEIQLDDYLKRTYKQPEDNWNEQLSVPWEFLSAHSKISEGDLRTAWRGSNLRTIAGVAGTQAVTVDTTGPWADIVKASLAGARDFLRDPKQFQNWDLCAGRMSTEEFDGLRAYHMGLNGGKLPADWGRNYLQLHATARAEWAKYEEASRVFNHNLPKLPELNLDTAIQQINDWLNTCLTKLEEDKANDPARLANRDACLALAEKVHAGGDKLYCRGCKAVLAQYWCPNDPDLGDHWMCGCSGVTQVAMMLRPDGRTYWAYADERKAAIDAMANQLRALADRMKDNGFGNRQVRGEIDAFLTSVNGGGYGPPLTAGLPAVPAPGSGPAAQATANNPQPAAPNASTPAASNPLPRAAAAPPVGTIVRNPQYRYTLQVPPNWHEAKETLSDDIVQRFRQDNTGYTLVEVSRVEAPQLSVEQLRQVSNKMMEGNPALARRVAESVPPVLTGTALVVTYTGTLNGKQIRSVVRYVSVGGEVFVIVGTTTKEATKDEWASLRAMVASFQCGK